MDTIYTSENDKIQKVFAYLRKAIDQEAEKARKLEKGNLGDVIEAAGFVKEFYKELDEIKTALGSIVNLYSAGIVPNVVMRHIEENNLPLEKSKTQHSQNFRATLSLRTSASIPGEKKDEALAWLRSNGYEDLIVETVNAQTLGNVANSLEAECQELPDELFKVSRAFTTTFTRSKPKL